MSEPRLISPMLDGFALGSSISDHSGVNCYPAMPNDSDEHYILKTISIPASQVQLEALLLTGAYSDAEAAGRYFQELADGIQREVEILQKLSARRGFLPYEKTQTVPMDEGVGYVVYLLSRYNQTLERHLKRAPLTHLSAVNLGIDLCAALAVCREAGYLYVDLKPGNIFLTGHQEYRIGDIGFVPLNSLKYASLPDRYRSAYTPPEISDAYATLNTTMDTYALGLTLYQIYNNGVLPFDSEASRAALMARLAEGEALPAPANADYEMAQIIEKALSLDPADRWADPVQMGQALVSYMQRNGANDTPIVPPAVPEPESVDEEEPEELPADAAPAGDTDAAEISADDADDAVETDDPADPTDDSADTPADDAGEDEDDADETPAADWIDRMDAILSEDGDEADDEDAEDDDPQPTLRQLLETDELDEAEAESVTDDELTDETAGMLTHVQELIDHEAPAPVVAPAPIDVPIPEPIVLEPDPDETEADASDEADDESDDADTTDTPADDTADESDDEESGAADDDMELDDEPDKKSGGLRKFLGVLAGLLAAAALAFGAYYYYQNYYLQTINSMNVDGLENQLTVTVDTAMDQSLLTVVCKDTYGNAQYGTLTDGSVTFTELLPGTQYIVSLEVEGFHQLVGAAPATYYTPAETKLLNLTAVTGQEDGSVIVSFGVEGVESDEWSVLCSAEGEEDRFVKFSGHTVTITGLTVGKTYTLTVTGGEDIYLVSENSLTHTASALVLAENLTVSGYSEGSITAVWTAPEGANVSRWVARCYNEDGYDQVLEVTEPKATFTGITENAAYTLEVTADGMTMSKRTFVTANPITITGVSAEAKDGAIHLSWTFEGQAPAGGWLVLYTADGGINQQLLNTDEPAAVLTAVAPGSHYDITIQTPDATSIFGGTAEADVPDTSAFEGYGLNTNRIGVSTYAIPETENWGSRELRDADKVTTFAPGSSMALLYSTGYRVQNSDDEIVSLFVIRDAEGKLVSLQSNVRSWSDMWYNGYCVETVKNLPAEAGSYTLTVYLNNQKLTIQNFTIA